MNHRENTLRAIRFERPERVPMTFHISPACWHHYDQEALKDLMEEHTLLFPDCKRPEDRVRPKYGLAERKDEPYKDPWGCVWETADNGITGTVRQHPLADWTGFDRYVGPDPGETDGTFPVDWPSIRRDAERQRENGDLVLGNLSHGHTFLRLQDIRGYENLLYDMIDERPQLFKLIEMIEEFNFQVVLNWMQLEPEMMSYPEDLGSQVGPMVSPDLFRKYIKPVYERIMKPARDKGCIVHMHSDGDIRSLVDDLIDGGVEVINLQDLVNDIDWIAQKFAGKVAIELDIDRQQITPRGTPQQIDNLVREEVEKLGSKEGGLMMIYGLYPRVPLENVRALMDAMEKYTTYYS